MVSKKELLKDLSNDLNFEEDIINKLTDFYNALGWRKTITKQHHKYIEDGLKILKADTEKHATIIQEMIKHIERGTKNEF